MRYMKRLKQIPLYILLFISCNSIRNPALNNLVSLYDGKFSLENETRSNSSGGKENYIRLSSLQNSLVEQGWLLPNAMANNCAILLFRSNPILFEGKDLLEVEIQIKNTEPFVFTYKRNELQEIDNKHEMVETTIKEFVENTIANDVDKVQSIGYTTNRPEQNFRSFFDAFKEVIPANYKDTKLISYAVLNKGGVSEYLIDAVLLTQDNIQKIINVSLIGSNDHIKIKEVKF